MSRSNPFKKKQRAAKKTVLIYGEGQAEEMFLKHLRHLYAHNSGVAITIKKGKGGTPNDVVTSAIRHLGSFDRKIVLIDNDKANQEILAARDTAKKHNIFLIENEPCLESLLLAILTSSSYKNQKSDWCKDEFERKYIPRDQRTDSRMYDKFFNKNILENQRKHMSILDKIISILEGKQV